MGVPVPVGYRERTWILVDGRSSSVVGRDRAACAQLNSDPIPRDLLDAIRSEKPHEEQSRQSPAYTVSHHPGRKAPLFGLEYQSDQRCSRCWSEFHQWRTRHRLAALGVLKVGTGEELSKPRPPGEDTLLARTCALH